MLPLGEAKCVNEVTTLVLPGAGVAEAAPDDDADGPIAVDGRPVGPTGDEKPGDDDTFPRSDGAEHPASTVNAAAVAVAAPKRATTCGSYGPRTRSLSVSPGVMCGRPSPSVGVPSDPRISMPRLKRAYPVFVGMRSVAADGSPIAVYRALPAGPGVDLIDAAIPRGGDVLDLGCGVGRIAAPLAARGHRVTGVDESAGMLHEARRRGVDVVHARIEDLTLTRRFDAVLLLSHLINTASVARRRRLWRACRRHVKNDGTVVIERHAPEWMRVAQPVRSSAGAVVIELTDVVRVGDELRATVVYRLGSRSWRQPFVAAELDDDRFGWEAGEAGLVLERWLDERRELACLRPSGARR